jgi:hypothetical protein
VRDLGYEEQVQKMLAASANKVNEGEWKKPSIWSRMGF